MGPHKTGFPCGFPETSKRGGQVRGISPGANQPPGGRSGACPVEFVHVDHVSNQTSRVHLCVQVEIDGLRSDLRLGNSDGHPCFLGSFVGIRFGDSSLFFLLLCREGKLVGCRNLRGARHLFVGKGGRGLVVPRSAIPTESP